MVDVDAVVVDGDGHVRRAGRHVPRFEREHVDAGDRASLTGVLEVPLLVEVRIGVRLIRPNEVRLGPAGLGASIEKRCGRQDIGIGIVQRDDPDVGESMLPHDVDVEAVDDGFDVVTGLDPDDDLRQCHGTLSAKKDGWQLALHAREVDERLTHRLRLDVVDDQDVARLVAVDLRLRTDDRSDLGDGRGVDLGDLERDGPPGRLVRPRHEATSDELIDAVLDELAVVDADSRAVERRHHRVHLTGVRHAGVGGSRVRRSRVRGRVRGVG